MLILIELTVAFLSLLAIVGAGSFAAKLLTGKRARWLGVLIALADYWFTMTTVSSALKPPEGSDGMTSIVMGWAASVIAGLLISAALSAGLRKLLPASA